MLGRHINKSQRRGMIYVAGTILAFGLILWHPWSGGSPQTSTGATYTPATDVPSIPQYIPAPTTTTNPKVFDQSTFDNSQGGNPLLSGTPRTAGMGAIAAAPSPSSTTVPPSATTTTGPANPAINYGAVVDPRFVQDPKNPLKVSYQMSATASIMADGEFLPVASLPTGTLEFFSDAVSGPICTMSVGGTVTGGSCMTTYPTFGKYNIVANYITGGNTYVSVILTDTVSPFSTKTVAGISGGGSLGGLVFFAAVTDSNGNAVTTGSVSLTIADVTQGWSYVVNGALSPDGAHQNDFGFVLVENYPSVGKYGSLGNSSIVVTPASGDNLTETAVFAGVTGWTGSTSGEVSYSMP